MTEHISISFRPDFSRSEPVDFDVSSGRRSFVSSQTVRRDEDGGCNACTGGSYETVTLVVLRSIEFRLCDECRESLSRMLANEPAPILVDGRVMRGDVEIEPKCPICGTAIVCPCGVGIGT